MNKDEQLLFDEPGMPEPALGKQVRTFSVPVDDKQARPAKKKNPPQISTLTEADFAAFNQEDYRDLSHAPRRRAREVALLLFFAAMGGSDWQLAQYILGNTGMSGEGAGFALRLAKQAFDRLEECDQILARYARDWDVERFSSVDRSILRLAVGELLGGGAEYNVVINEAIELGKKFGSEESGAFINGMLDNIYTCEIKPRLGGAGEQV